MCEVCTIGGEVSKASRVGALKGVEFEFTTEDESVWFDAISALQNISKLLHELCSDCDCQHRTSQ